jgi:hypothetical protein
MKYTKIMMAGLLTISSLTCFQNAVADITHVKMGEGIQRIKVKNESWQPDGFKTGTIIPVLYQPQDHMELDGKELESAWSDADEVMLELAYGKLDNASVKAVYTDEDLYIRVRWRDQSESREHRPWVWDSVSSRYSPGPQIEDSIILSFEAGCEWFPSFLIGYDYDFDGWQWLAARSDPIGQALDLTGSVKDQQLPNHAAYQSRYNQDTWNLKFIDRNEGILHKPWYELDRQYMLWSSLDTIYFSGKVDGIRSQNYVEVLPAPESAPVDPQQTFPQYQPIGLKGNAGDVKAKGHWEDGFWTVEFSRKLLTKSGESWDVQFDRLSQFSIHVFDAVERIDQSSESGALFLQFLAKD